MTTFSIIPKSQLEGAMRIDADIRFVEHGRKANMVFAECAGNNEGKRLQVRCQGNAVKIFRTVQMLMDQGHGANPHLDVTNDAQEIRVGVVPDLKTEQAHDNGKVVFYPMMDFPEHDLLLLDIFLLQFLNFLFFGTIAHDGQNLDHLMVFVYRKKLQTYK